MADTPLYLQAHFREQVKDAFETSIQQDESKFRDMGMVDPEWTADQIVFRTSAPVQFVETTGQRGGKTQQGEFLAGFRSGFVRDFECGIQFDRNDARKLFTANLPTSEVQQEMRMAWARKMDDLFIDASLALALGGPKPYITSQANPSFMSIPVDWAQTAVNAGVNTHATIWKIEEALTRMMVNNVDLDRETVTIYISPQMRQKWLSYAQTAPNETFANMLANYRQTPSSGLLGCRVVVTNRLARNSSGHVQMIIATKRAFKVNAPTYDIRIDTLPDERHSIQIAAYAKMGVVRRWDELVVGAWVDETAGLV